MIRARDLTVTRRGRPLLEQVSLTLDPGTVTVVAGPNGAGKSTLLRLLSGDWTPDTGTIEINGRSILAWSLEEMARWRAVLPQHSALEFPFSVSEVVMLGRTPHSRGWDGPQDRDLVAQALARVEMDMLSDRQYPTLSGGERQRVHLARALAQIARIPPRPSPILLLDEPTAALDLAHRFQVMQIARQEANRGAVVMVILHDLNLAFGADQVILLDAGRLVAAGSPAEVFRVDILQAVFQARPLIWRSAEASHPVIAWEPLFPVPDA